MKGFDLPDSSYTRERNSLPYSPRSYEQVKQNAQCRQTEVVDALEKIAAQHADDAREVKLHANEEAKKAAAKYNQRSSEGMNMAESVTIRGRILNMENLDQCSDANCRVEGRIALYKNSAFEGRRQVPMSHGMVDVAKLCSGNWKKEDVEEYIRGRRPMLTRPKSAPNFIARNRSAQSLNSRCQAQVSITTNMRKMRTEAIWMRKVEELDALRARAFARTSSFKGSYNAHQQALDWIKMLVVGSFCERIYFSVSVERTMRKRAALAKNFHFVIRVLRFIRNCKRKVRTTRNWKVAISYVRCFRLVFRKRSRHRLIYILKDFLGRLGDAFKIQYGVRQYIWATRTVQRRWRAFSLWMKSYCLGELMESFRAAEGQFLGSMLGQLVDDDVMIIDKTKLKAFQGKKKSVSKANSGTLKNDSKGGNSSARSSSPEGKLNRADSSTPSSPLSSRTFSRTNSQTNTTPKSRASMALEKALAEPAKKKTGGKRKQSRPSSAAPVAKEKQIVRKRPASATGSRPQGGNKSDAPSSGKDGGRLVKMAHQASQVRVEAHRFKRKYVYAMLRREVIEKLHTYCSTLVRFREAIAGEMEMAKDWIQFRDYIQGGDGSTKKTRIREEAKQLKLELQARKAKSPSSEPGAWSFGKKAMHELVLAAHGSMGTRPKSQARFEELFGHCPPFLLDSLPRKLAGDQTIRVSMMLRQEYRANPDGKVVIESRHGAKDGSSPTKMATFNVVKKMMEYRDIEDTFFAAEVFSRELCTKDGDSQSEPVFGRLRRHRNMMLSQAPITNIDGESESTDSSDEADDE